MRSAVLLGLPLTALAIPAPVTPNKRPFDERAEDFNPYVVDSGCRGKKYNNVDAYDKLLNAVKEAREMAKFAIKEWWDEGKHGEAAATYLGIPDDGKYKDNEFAQWVHANLQGVALLDERLPFLSKRIVSRSSACRLRLLCSHGQNLTYSSPSRTFIAPTSATSASRRLRERISSLPDMPKTAEVPSQDTPTTLPFVRLGS